MPAGRNGSSTPRAAVPRPPPPWAPMAADVCGGATLPAVQRHRITYIHLNHHCNNYAFTAAASRPVPAAATRATGRPSSTLTAADCQPARLLRRLQHHLPCTAHQLPPPAAPAAPAAAGMLSVAPPGPAPHPAATAAGCSTDCCLRWRRAPAVSAQQPSCLLRVPVPHCCCCCRR